MLPGGIERQAEGSSQPLIGHTEVTLSFCGSISARLFLSSRFT